MSEDNSVGTKLVLFVGGPADGRRIVVPRPLNFHHKVAYKMENGDMNAASYYRVHFSGDESVYLFGAFTPDQLFGILIARYPAPFPIQS